MYSKNYNVGFKFNHNFTLLNGGGVLWSGERIISDYTYDELKQIYLYEKWNKLKPSMYEFILCNNKKNNTYLPDDIIKNITHYLKIGIENPKNKVWLCDNYENLCFIDMQQCYSLINKSKLKLENLESKIQKSQQNSPRVPEDYTDVKGRLYFSINPRRHEPNREEKRKKRVNQTLNLLKKRELIVENIMSELNEMIPEDSNL